LRNKYDAILTGSTTVIADNPSLTARIKNGIAVRLNLLIPTKVLCAAVRTDTSIGTIWRIAARDEIPIA